MWNVIIPSASNRFPILNDPVPKMVDVAVLMIAAVFGDSSAESNPVVVNPI